MAAILSVGPDRELLAVRNRALAQLGYDVRGAATRVDALTAARSNRFDVALLCNTFPEGYAAEFARELASLMPTTPVLHVPDGGAANTLDDIQQMIEDIVARPKAA